jgi:outer membrane protein assembly factor BamB
MKKNKFKLILLVIVAAMLLSSCSGALLSGSSWPGVSSNGDTLYVAYMNHVYAVRVSDGSMLWRFPESSGRSMFFATPVLADSQLLVGDYDSNLHSLDPNTGVERWVFSEANGDWIASPLVVNDMILAPNGDHNLYALAMNGSLLWKFTTENALWSRPISDGEFVYQASMDHNLYAINLRDGSKVWSLELGGAVIYSPTLSEDGTIYISTLARNLLAIDAATGQVKWQRSFEENLWAQPALNDDRLYFGDLSGQVYALSSTDGSNIWTQNVGQPVTGQPTIMNTTVIFPTEEGSLIAMSLNGDRLWSKTVEGKLYTGPVVSGDRLAVGITGGSDFLKLIGDNGLDIWTFVPPK